MTWDNFLYPVLYCLSAVTFGLIARRLMKGRRLQGEIVNLLLLCFVTGMIFGAHALFFLFCEGSFSHHQLLEYYSEISESLETTGLEAGVFQTLINFFTMSMAGLWGGPLFAILMMLAYLFLLRLDLKDKFEALNVFAIALPFALAVAKLGCFLAGCCCGYEGEGWYFIKNTWSSTYPLYCKNPRFPTQLLDMLFYLGAGAILLIVRRKRRDDNRLFIYFILLYSVGRIFSETTRGDNIGGKLYGLSPVQIVLLAAVILGILFLLIPKLYRGLFSFMLPRIGPVNTVERTPNEIRKRITRINRFIFIGLLVYYLLYYSVILSALLVFFIVPFARLIFIGKKNDPVLLYRLHTYLVFLVFGIFSATTVALGRFIPFYIWFVLFMATSVIIMNRYFSNEGTEV
ncbi:MAG: hypothetical protein E3J72_17550 [Planctomycetota bacterium]|nr:MAG: hypothetical protein E3J72_17550 [Planctomycetota bacterium]